MTQLAQTKKEADNLCKYVQEVHDIEGDVVEIGVFKGGTAEILNQYKAANKKLYLFDTFEGLTDCGPLDIGSVQNPLTNGLCQASYQEVRSLFKSDVEIIAGYFPESAPEGFENKKFSFVHLDVDTYKSTLNSLAFFYPRMSVNAIIVMHDYINSNAPGVKVAIDEFFSNKQEKVIFLCDSQCMIKKEWQFSEDLDPYRSYMGNRHYHNVL